LSIRKTENASAKLRETERKDRKGKKKKGRKEFKRIIEARVTTSVTRQCPEEKKKVFQEQSTTNRDGRKNKL
jgi:hypothetical protein